VITGNIVSANYFDVLGLRPVRGRTIGPEEEHAESNPVIMISDALWSRRFQRDPGVIGRLIRLNGRPCPVIGIVPSQFRGLLNASIMPAEAWIPLSMAEQVGLKKHGPEEPWLQLTARLRPGISIEAAQASMPTLVRELEQALPKTYRPSFAFDNVYSINFS
jgi:hypothetical protein